MARHQRSRTVDGKQVYSPTYFCWRNMRSRCQRASDKTYAYYGGRGITVCERWQDYDNFVDDMGEMPVGHTIDRIDPDGNYEPGNCRWATRDTNQRNRRDSCKLPWNGRTMHIREWAEEVGVASDTLYRRVFKRGWDVEKALTKKSQRRAT